MSDVGHNSSGEVNGGQLLAFVERIEALELEIRDRNSDKKEVYSERSSGLDAKIVKKIVGIRRQDPSERSEEEVLLDVYMRALEGSGK